MRFVAGMRESTRGFDAVVATNLTGTWNLTQAVANGWMIENGGGRIINITVAPSNPHDPPRLLNYITSPHVIVWSAALASACLHPLFGKT